MVERPFTYSAFPGRFATPLFGACAALLVGFAGMAGVQGMRHVPAVVLIAGAAVLFGAGRWLARRGVLRLPLLRATGVNLEAIRGATTPVLWLSAHLDSKSQPIPTLLRAAGIVLAASGYLITTIVAVALSAQGSSHPLFWTFAAGVTLVGAIPVVLSTVGERSNGALDNASGVATIMAAARLIGMAERVGILITDAEELGLAGARAWAAGKREGLTVLNCDGVDDAGDLQVMFSGRRPEKLLAAVRAASQRTATASSIGRLIPGVLTDSVAFADAGMQAATFSRGSWASLARIHTRRDDLEHLDGTGIAPVAALMATTVNALGGNEP